MNYWQIFFPFFFQSTYDIVNTFLFPSISHSLLMVCIVHDHDCKEKNVCCILNEQITKNKTKQQTHNIYFQRRERVRWRMRWRDWRRRPDSWPPRQPRTKANQTRAYCLSGENFNVFMAPVWPFKCSFVRPDKAGVRLLPVDIKYSLIKCYVLSDIENRLWYGLLVTRHVGHRTSHQVRFQVSRLQIYVTSL